MNREIKFRIFSKIFNEHEMFYDVEMILKSDGYWWQFNNKLRMYQSGERCAVMQFTGLKDKNGVEIYEGDIVQVYNQYNGIAAHGYAKVVFSYEYVGGWVITTDGTNYLTIGTRPNYIEVVGNEYENPELLNA